MRTIPRGSVLVPVGHTDRQCSGYVGHNERKSSRTLGAYRQEVFWCMWGIPTGSVLVYVGIPTGSVLVYVGIPTGSVLVYVGIPRGSDLMYVWHTDRNVLGKVQQVFFLI